ncbi:MAG TPA: dienelactone hydrolase family protein [Acidobacteriaceae bacterium]|jgi:carboxymethylenebutenolidase
MAEIVRLHAKDGHTLDAYAAQAGVPATAGLVIVQEIFGVNAHIRAVAEHYADEGFVTIAPALFDRIEPGVELGDEGEDRQRAVALLAKFDVEKGVEDIAAAVEWLRGFGRFGPFGVGVVGYCLGGTLAWLSATRLPIDAAVGYYGGRIANYLGERPKVPILLHFGEQDQHIPQSEIDAIRKAHREVPIYTYPAGHAFNREGSAGYDASSATRARERTLEFLHEHLC